MEEQDKFEAWGLLELFGHQRLAGRLTNQAVGGCHFIRCDVPDVEGQAGYTRFFGNGAIYGITITSEDVARKLAANLRARPVQAYELEPGAGLLTRDQFRDRDESEDEP